MQSINSCVFSQVCRELLDRFWGPLPTLNHDLAGNFIMVNRFVTGKKFKAWLKHLGFLGFMFFFIKGLVWIALIYFGVKIF